MPSSILTQNLEHSTWEQPQRLKSVYPQVKHSRCRRTTKFPASHYCHASTQGPLRRGARGCSVLVAPCAQPCRLVSPWPQACRKDAIAAFLLEALASSEQRAQLVGVTPSYLTGFNQNERDKLK